MVRRSTVVSLTVALAALLGTGPLSVSAITYPNSTSTGSTGNSRVFTTTVNQTANANANDTGNTNVSNTNASNANASTNTNHGLEAAKLQVCENRQTAINRILDRMARRAERHVEVFTDIATRVEAFYADKGYSLTNYDALVADVNAKEAAAQTQVQSLQARTTFSCTGDNPQGLITAFKQQLSDTIDALKAYQTAVRNLIVGVKSAVGQANGTGNANVSNTNASNGNT